MKIIKNSNQAWLLAASAAIFIAATFGFYIYQGQATDGYIMTSGSSSILQVGGGAVLGLDLTSSNNGLIVKGGKVGLGTTAPTAGLDVRSDAYFAKSGGIIQTMENINGDITASMTLGKQVFMGYETGDNTHRTGAVIEARTTGGWGDTNGVTDAPTSLIFYANSQDSYSPSSAAPDLIITTNGVPTTSAVGIGGWPVNLDPNLMLGAKLAVFGGLGVEGTVAATAYKVGSSAGASATVSVRNAAGTGSCHLYFGGGLFTGTDCP